MNDRKLDWKKCVPPVYRGQWQLTHWCLTPVALGLMVDNPAINHGQHSHWELLDLLDLLHEVSLQADCLMPLVILLPKNDKLFSWRRRQDYHRGRYMLLFSEKKTNGSEREKLLDPLLSPLADDISLKPPELKTFGDIRENAKKELTDESQIHFNNLVDEFFPTSHAAPSPAKEEKETEDVGRIKAATIRGFKGIRELNLPDLDADIILVTGANGNGKSSFVEALSLTLTGFHPDMDYGDSSLAPDHFFFMGKQKFSIDLSMSGPARKNVTLNAERDTISMEAPAIMRKTDSSENNAETWTEVAAELNYRLTTFLPEHVNMLFDPEQEKDREKSEPRTIADLFPRLPPAAEKIFHDVNKKLKELEEQKDTIDREEQSLNQEAQNVFTRAQSFFNTFGELLSQWAELINLEPPVPVEEWKKGSAGPEELSKILDLQRQALRNTLGEIALWKKSDLQSLLKIRWQNFLSTQKQVDLEQLGEAINQLERKKQILTERLRQIEIERGNLNSLEEILSQLGETDRLEEWLLDLRLTGATTVAEEVALVRPERARQCAEDLRHIFTGNREEIEQKREKTDFELQEKKKEYDRVLEEKKEFAAYKKLADFLKKQESISRGLDTFEDNLKKINDKRNTYQQSNGQILEEILKFLESRQSDPEEFRKGLEKSLNHVLRRFVLAQDMDKVELTGKDRYIIKADAEEIKEEEQVTVAQKQKFQRDRHCFSSGQKAQMAMAWMVACREILHKEVNREYVRFPHRVIIMDDPSTTFDQNNLHSQAVLWRQLAYNKKPGKRFQIFIVSHHEEFSARLLDLLCPPGSKNDGAECRMKLLRFTDWTTDKGAQHECFDVEPAPRDLDKAEDLFKSGLNYLGREQ